MQWHIKRETNDKLRQKFIDKTVDQAHLIGLTVPDSALHYDEESEHWLIGAINWDEFWQVVGGHGPCNHQRMKHHIHYHQEGQWVREAASEFSKKQYSASF